LKFIQSVQRAFSILEYILLNNGAGISDLSRKFNLNKSTVFSIVKTLEQLGYVYQCNSLNSYLPTYRIHSIATSCTTENSIVAFAHPYIYQLSKKYGETVHFVNGREHSVVYVDKVESDKNIRYHTDLGSEMPLHCTGVGKAILAWRSEAEINEYIDAGLVALTEKTITDPETLHEVIHKIRKNGYSIDDEENSEGLFCIGVPIFNKSGAVVHSISISLPKYRLSEINIDEAVSDLKRTAAEIMKFY